MRSCRSGRDPSGGATGPAGQRVGTAPACAVRTVADGGLWWCAVLENVWVVDHRSVLPENPGRRGWRLSYERKSWESVDIAGDSQAWGNPGKTISPH
jgi:hypothetical protein